MPFPNLKKDPLNYSDRPELLRVSAYAPIFLTTPLRSCAQALTHHSHHGRIQPFTLRASWQQVQEAVCDHWRRLFLIVATKTKDACSSSPRGSCHEDIKTKLSHKLCDSTAEPEPRSQPDLFNSLAACIASRGSGVWALCRCGGGLRPH
jgi:hypothetical protein